MYDIIKLIVGYGFVENNHYVTTRDMAKIAAYIADNSPDVLKIQYTLDYKGINIVNETKELQESSRYYYEYAVKTLDKNKSM